MTAESAKAFEALEGQARDLVALFGRAGYEFVAPAILQPAGVFLDQIGEQVRGRSYVFTDLAGEELCLRPDLTVPVSRLYLERHPQAGTEARYCYNGPAFRFQPLGPSATHPREFRQAGVECFGAADKAAADTEVLLLAVEAVRSAGLRDYRLRFGDIALFYALVDALDVPERWRETLDRLRPQVACALELAPGCRDWQAAEHALVPAAWRRGEQLLLERGPAAAYPSFALATMVAAEPSTVELAIYRYCRAAADGEADTVERLVAIIRRLGPPASLARVFE